jgi:hypothetical protein
MHISHEASPPLAAVLDGLRALPIQHGCRARKSLPSCPVWTVEPLFQRQVTGRQLRRHLQRVAPVWRKRLWLVRRLDPIGMTSLSAATPILCFAVALPKS